MKNSILLVLFISVISFNASAGYNYQKGKYCVTNKGAFTINFRPFIYLYAYKIPVNPIKYIGKTGDYPVGQTRCFDFNAIKDKLPDMVLDLYHEVPENIRSLSYYKPLLLFGARSHVNGGVHHKSCGAKILYDQLFNRGGGFTLSGTVFKIHCHDDD